MGHHQNPSAPSLLNLRAHPRPVHYPWGKRYQTPFCSHGDSKCVKPLCVARGFQAGSHTMDRSFVIVHISDLHLDGAGTYNSAMKALLSTINEKMQQFASAGDRILLITGDLVNDPTPRAFSEAKAILGDFRATNIFTDIRAIAGNHDVKRLGLVFRNDDA